MLRHTFVCALAICLLSSCGSEQKAAARDPKAAAEATAGYTVVRKMPLASSIALSSELVPFQEIDVYAKEAGYVKQLLVDYGSHVKRGQLLAVLEIPELQALLEQDKAAITAAKDRIARAQHDITTAEAQHKVAQLVYERLASVAKMKPGLVAQQEVDDAEGKSLASQGRLESAKAAVEGAESELAVANAKLAHDRALYSYSRITAPFDGVVTQRYANLGALMQAGTNSSTQAMPLVRLSQEDKFRLVIPVPENVVRYVAIGDAVEVRVPSLAHEFAGKVVRISADVAEQTRTMHTEVDIENVNHELMPGLYAEAVLKLESNRNALAIPIQAIDRDGARASVMVVRPDNTVDECEISLGMQTPKFAEVTSGLKEGERVIVTERGALEAGQKVRARTVNLLD
ncbi:MAG TPA: efflux RND transporter periplasmic adaptor subunit [Bryobacteraceae bacterium]|jgi:RND family efflux transporter MFP subunit